MTKEIYYKTDFNLECPVNDYDAAREYLLEDDMTKYLVDSLRGDNVNEEEIMKIKNIKWILQDTQSGYILLTTTDVLPNNILSMISEWVLGQNSDGLGEGFEQQDFAEYDSEDYYDEDDYDDEYCMASFDWKTNKYPFKRVNSPYSLRENYHVIRLDEMNSNINSDIDYHDRETCRKIWKDLQSAGVRGKAYWDCSNVPNRGTLVVVLGWNYTDKQYDEFCDACDEFGYNANRIDVCGDVSGPRIEPL